MGHTQAVLVREGGVGTAPADTEEHWLRRPGDGWESSGETAGFLEVFVDHLEADPGRVACSWLVPAGRSGFDSHSFTFRHLADRAWRAWRGLEARGLEAGDRVLLCLSRPDDLLACLLASMAGGFVPVPLPPLGEMAVPLAFLERVRGVAADCGPRLVVADLRSRQRLEGETRSDLPVVDPQALESQPGLDLPPSRSFPRRPRGEIAFLQYTSGSTGSPRGVVVTHANLAANVRTIGLTSAVGPGDRMVTWLPLHHDMGLVGGLLFPLYWGIPTHLMSPLTFIASPLSWLRAISQLRGTYSVAPNFAYSLCLHRISDHDLEQLDLSSWRLAFNGGEPVDAATARGFIERFAACGFRAQSYYPVYGMAEATLAAAFPTPGAGPVFDTVERGALTTRGQALPAPPDSPQAVTFVSVGQPVAGHRVRIVDPQSRRPLPERQVGEIVLAGPSVTPRYFGQQGPDRQELATGDLGYVADGHLYVIDRLKDLIIIGGQNFAPSDIEGAAAGVSGLRRGRVAAFSVPGPLGTEALCLAAEVKPGLQNRESLRQEVARAVRERLGLAVAEVVLVAPGALPRTTSGKLRRQECRRLYLEGLLASSPGLGARLAGAVGRVGRLVAAGRAPLDGAGVPGPEAPGQAP
jgi:acyl-CoA synthetase (AMP-forming)/AMP-acid ligase II